MTCRNTAIIGISCQISRNILDITNVTGLVGIWVRMIIPIFIWWLPKGRCYGSQLNLGAVCTRCMERPLLFALAFDNRFDDREATFKRLNGNNLVTSCTNLVNFSPIIWKFMLLKYSSRPQFDDRSTFGTLAFRNGLEDRTLILEEYSAIISVHLVEIWSDLDQ